MMRLFVPVVLSALMQAGLWSAPETEDPSLDAAGSARGLDSSEMMQREIDRRKEITFQMNEILDLADRLYLSGEWDHAEQKYNLVMLQADAESQLGGFHQRARIGKARCLAAKALAKEEEGKLSEAAGLFRQAAELDPTNKTIRRKSADLEEASGRLADPYPGNAAVTTDLMRKTEEIKKLLSLADQLTETGQYIEARKKLDDVLRIDPYHRVARKKIEVLEEKRLAW